MKPGFLLPVVLFCFSCATKDRSKKPQQEPTAYEIRPSLSLFTDTLKHLDNSKRSILDSALRLYDILAPADSSEADSAAAALMNFVGQVVTKQNESLQNDTTGYFALLNPANGQLTDKQKALASELHEAKLKLVGDGEGGINIVPAYGTILPVVKAKSSAAVDNYLDLVAKEDTTPTFLDAGLAIEITELADRLITTENLLNQKLPKSFAVEAARLNKFYTNSLIRGADNSPALEDDGITLTEQFRQGYDYLLTKYPQSKAAAKINVWTAVIKSADKKKIDDYLKLLNE